MQQGQVQGDVRGPRAGGRGHGLIHPAGLCQRGHAAVCVRPLSVRRHGAVQSIVEGHGELLIGPVQKISVPVGATIDRFIRDGVCGAGEGIGVYAASVQRQDELLVHFSAQTFSVHLKLWFLRTSGNVILCKTHS